MSNWSPRELQAISIFAEKSLPKLRRLQDVVNQQIELVNKKPAEAAVFHNKSKEEVLWYLQRMDKILAAAVDKKCFKD